MNQRITLLFVFLFLAFGAMAQKGAISGTIIDESLAEGLIGANILVEELGTGTSTDFDGKYQLQLDPGIYTLVVTYIGFADKRIEEVEVKANETTVMDVSMTDDAVQLDVEIVVKAKAIERSENALLMLQRKSDKIQDGISAQEIARIGAGDAAGALKKVTGTTIVDGKYVYVRGLGDRYSSTTLNGTRLPSIDPYRNAAQMDLIPTNLIDNIIASKTFTPDLPGDFTGGSVNIKMKTLPERFTLNFSTSVNYNSQTTFEDDFLTFEVGDQKWLGLNDGTLDLPSEAADEKANTIDEVYVLSSTGRSVARTNDAVAARLDEVVKSFNNDFSFDEETAPLDQSFSFSVGNQFSLGEMPLGALLAVNYSNEFRQIDNGLFSNYLNPIGRPTLERVYELRGDKNTQTPSYSGLAGLSFRPGSSTEIAVYGILSHQTDIQGTILAGSYDPFGSIEPDGVFTSRTFSFRERQLVDFVLNAQHVFENGIRIDLSGNYVTTEQNEPDLRFFADEYELARDRYSISASEFNLPGHFFRELQDDAYEVKLDFTVPFLKELNSGNKIKFGGLLYSMDRDFTELIYNMNRFRGERYAGDADAYFADSNLGIVGGESGNNEIGLFIEDASLPTNSYTGTADINAGYAMITYNFTDQFKIIGGARLETTDYHVESEAAETSPNPETQIGDIEETDLLPAVNLVYALTEEMNLRASYSNTLARPNLREIAPFGSFGFIGEPLVFGNPALKRSRINNYDLRYEYFMNPGEIIAVSAFFKEFQDPIQKTFRQAGNLQFTWVNTQEATLYGFEFELRKRLDFLTPALKDFTFSGNFAYIVSEVKLDPAELELNRDVDPDFSETRQFAGQSPYVANANITYVNAEGGWDAALAFNVFGDRIDALGAVGTPNIFEQSRATLDATVSKRFGKFTVKLRGGNLINPEYKTFATFNDQEYIFSRYKVGRNFKLGLSYGF